MADKTFILLSSAIAIAANPAQAFERQHKSHTHGIAELQIAVERDSLHLRLESPAINLVGFEHKPENSEQQATVNRAVELLNSSDKLITLPKAAGCTPSYKEIKHSLTSKNSHDEHKHHDQHEEHKHHDDHDTHDEHRSHSDFVINYSFDCKSTEKIYQLNAVIFNHFPLLEKLEVNYITSQGQGRSELTQEQQLLKF